METKLLKELKKGEYFTLREVKEPKESQVYVRGEYDKSQRKFECQRFTDIWGNGKMLKGNTIVYVGFTF